MALVLFIAIATIVGTFCLTSLIGLGLGGFSGCWHPQGGITLFDLLQTGSWFLGIGAMIACAQILPHFAQWSLLIQLVIVFLHSLPVMATGFIISDSIQSRSKSPI